MNQIAQHTNFTQEDKKYIVSASRILSVTFLFIAVSFSWVIFKQNIQDLSIFAITLFNLLMYCFACKFFLLKDIQYWTIITHANGKTELAITDINEWIIPKKGGKKSFLDTIMIIVSWFCIVSILFNFIGSFLVLYFQERFFELLFPTIFFLIILLCVVFDKNKKPPKAKLFRVKKLVFCCKISWIFIFIFVINKLIQFIYIH